VNADESEPDVQGPRDHRWTPHALLEAHRHRGRTRSAAEVRVHLIRGEVHRAWDASWSARSPRAMDDVSHHSRFTCIAARAPNLRTKKTALMNRSRGSRQSAHQSRRSRRRRVVRPCDKRSTTPRRLPDVAQHLAPLCVQRVVSLAIPRAPATKLFSVCGHVAAPGPIYEVTMGFPLKDLPV